MKMTGFFHLGEIETCFGFRTNEKLERCLHRWFSLGCSPHSGRFFVAPAMENESSPRY
jgi:hypothetical protein